jgi:hypothetical protein
MLSTTAGAHVRLGLRVLQCLTMPTLHECRSRRPHDLGQSEQDEHEDQDDEHTDDEADEVVAVHVYRLPAVEGVEQLPKRP